jgi:hypothetical protein
MCGAVLIVGLLWIIVTALIARSKLQNAQAELPKLRTALLSGDMTSARALAADIRSNASSAHGLVSGPAWWVAANLPVVGTPLATTRDVAAAADSVGNDVLPGLVTLAGTIHNSTLRSGSTINLPLLQDSVRVVDRAGNAAAKAMAAVSGAAHSSWLPPVDHGRTKFSKQLDELDSYLVGADRALQIGLPMLGQTTPQRYFLAFENDAEARGLGGLPGAFAIVVTDHGKLRFTHFGNDSELTGTSTGLNFGPGYEASYAGADPQSNYKNSDISPHFPFAARIWAAMWQKHSGQHIDGAIALDPTALGYLLKASGPARASDGTMITSGNVVALTESVQYAKFAVRAERQKWVVLISKAVSKKLTSGGDVAALAKAMTHAARERRLVVWSAHPAVERELELAGYAGTLEAGAGPVSAFTVVNATGSKLDYYLDRSMTYHRDGCGTGSTVVASLTVTNDAPATGLPPYVTERADKVPSGARPGDDHAIISYFATGGATIKSVTVNGKQQGVATSDENGLPLIRFDIELKIGTPERVVVTTSEPAASGSVTILRQPLVRPLDVTTSGSRCGA